MCPNKILFIIIILHVISCLSFLYQLKSRTIFEFVWRDCIFGLFLGWCRVWCYCCDFLSHIESNDYCRFLYTRMHEPSNISQAQAELRLCFVGAQLLFLLLLVNYYVGFDISNGRYSSSCTYGILSLDISLFLFTQLLLCFYFYEVVKFVQ